MINAPDLNTFQYIVQNKGLLQGIGVALDTLTFAFDHRNKHSSMLVHHLIAYVHAQPEFKALNLLPMDMLDGNPNNMRHHIIHPCKDGLEHAFHLHLVYSKIVTPEVVNLFLTSMEKLEKSPALRASVLQKNFFLRSIDAIAGIELYDPDQPLTFLSKNDRNRLKDKFHSAYDEGFLKPALQTCPTDQHLARYVHMNDFPKCEAHDGLPLLPSWQPSDMESFRANARELTTMKNAMEQHQQRSSMLNNADTVLGLVMLGGMAWNWLGRRAEGNNNARENRAHRD